MTLEYTNSIKACPEFTEGLVPSSTTDAAAEVGECSWKRHFNGYGAGTHFDLSTGGNLPYKQKVRYEPSVTSWPSSNNTSKRARMLLNGG